MYKNLFNNLANDRRNMYKPADGADVSVGDDTPEVDDEVEEGDKTTFTGEIKKAYGELLKTPVKFTAEYFKIKSFTDIPEDEMPGKKDILKYVNDARKLNARQKFATDALKLAGINKPDPNDPKVVMARMLKDIQVLDIPQEQKDMMSAVIRQKQSA